MIDDYCGGGGEGGRKRSKIVENRENRQKTLFLKNAVSGSFSDQNASRRALPPILFLGLEKLISL